MTYRPTALGFLLSAFLTSGSRSSPAAESPEPKAAVISISKFAFAPAEVSIAQGDTIEWSNDDVFRHAVAADSGAWSSPELRRGDRFVFVPTEAGRFPYHCALHPVMSGTIVVRP